MFWLELALSLSASVSCKPTTIHDALGFGWTKRDQLALVTAQRRCPTLYPNSPCLIRFYRRAPLTYWAVCGASRR